MAHMARQHRPAARLGQITDIKPPPRRLFSDFGREILYEIDQFGMAPVAIARQPHRGPCRPRLGQARRPGQTAARITADHGTLAAVGPLRSTEQQPRLLPRQRGIERRKAWAFLRRGAARHHGQNTQSGQTDTHVHTRSSPSARTQMIRIRPSTNNPIKGTIPSRALSVR